MLAALAYIECGFAAGKESSGGGWVRYFYLGENIMSRAYRIKVSETLRTVIRAEDHVSSPLEVLGILPGAQMGELLAQELQGRGFRREGDLAVREEEDGVVVEVDLKSGMVTVRAEGSEEVELKGERDGWAYERQNRKKATDNLRDTVRKELRNQATDLTGELQKKITDRLEGRLADLKAELDQAVNRVTAEALKRKAASMGRIKEIADDPQTGSLTIVVEV